MCSDRRADSPTLNLTRIESGQTRRELGAFDLREAALSAIETVSAAAAAREIAVELHAPDKAPMNADRGEIESVLNNLISNAVKYNRDKGRVDVTLEAANPGVGSTFTVTLPGA
jgi:signal transduction histidine kinase